MFLIIWFQIMAMATLRKGLSIPFNGIGEALSASKTSLKMCGRVLQMPMNPIDKEVLMQKMLVKIRGN